MHFLCLLDRCRSSQSTSSRLPSPSFSPLFLPRVPPSNRPPGINYSSDLSRLTCLPIGQPGRVVNLPLDCCSISPPPRSFRYRRYTRTFRSFIELFFLFALWRKEFDSKNGEIEIERFSIFSVLSEIGIGNG